jgi:hypothetical protein
MTNQPQAVEESRAVAVWSGMELKLPGGHVVPFLFCSAHASEGGFFVEMEGATVDDEASPEVSCPHCNTGHFVWRLADALQAGELDEALGESDPSFRLEDLIAITIRGRAHDSVIRREDS